MTTKELTQDEIISTLMDIFTKPDFDWDAYWEIHGDSPDYLFRKVARLSNDNDGDPDLFECGSCGLEDDCKGLYRLLWLLGPKGVDFDDMYKTTLFWFCSIDARFWVQVYLWKYQPALYFFTTEPSLISGNGHAGEVDGFVFSISSGIPGSDNGWNIADETGRRFFEVVKAAMNHTWMVYGGNDFEV